MNNNPKFKKDIQREDAAYQPSSDQSGGLQLSSNAKKLFMSSRLGDVHTVYMRATIVLCTQTDNITRQNC